MSNQDFCENVCLLIGAGLSENSSKALADFMFYAEWDYIMGYLRYKGGLISWPV